MSAGFAGLVCEVMLFRPDIEVVLAVDDATLCDEELEASHTAGLEAEISVASAATDESADIESPAVSSLAALFAFSLLFAVFGVFLAEAVLAGLDHTLV